MAEIFDVRYNIEVFSYPAVQSINNFVNAVNKLSGVSTKLQNFQNTLRQIETMSTKGLALNIKTDVAMKRLEAVYNKIGQIKNAAAKINLGVAGSTNNVTNGNKGTSSTIATRTIATTTPQRTYTPKTGTTRTGARTQGPRPLVGSRAGQPLIPRNLEYQVLGPTRLGNVAMLDMFKGMGVMYGISALGSGIRDIITTSTDYQNVMQTAKNILKTNYTGNNFNASFADMERIVRDVGMETKFTAPEVADAVKFLAMAGLDINAISKSIRPIADIALIGDTDLGATADVMTNIMTAYGIKPDDMRKTADVMTRTFTMSNTTLMELAESFKMAGSMLHLANVPFETAAAAFGVLGDAGIKATMAGTTMRTIMNNLRNPTKGQKSYWDMLGVRRYDEYGNLREINDIFADLNRLNGSDARSAEAKKRYEELQKKYAPKLEGLTEGSTEYNKLLAQYDQESEAIRKQFGGVDVFRLFRLTAASGAGVLMSQVEKWNKIIEENFMSEGLSKKLADEKKNTIQGLWAQLKSAFQEGGLKVFEENDGALRGYLRKGIAWLKSDDFTNILRNAIDLVASLGKTLIDFTGIIVKLYDKFAPLVKAYLQFQLYAKGIQTVLISIKGLGNSFLYLVSSFFGLRGRPMYGGTVRGMAPVGMYGMGGPAAMYGMSGWYSSVLYNNPFWKHMGPGYTKLLETGSPAAAMRADKSYIRPGSANWDINKSQRTNLALYRSYQSKNRRIQAMNNYSGLGMIGGAVLGGMIGNNFNDENGMMWGSIIGGGLGSFAPMLFSAGPWGAFAAVAITAITGVTSYIVRFHRELDEAKKHLDYFNNNEVRLGLRNIDVSDAESVFRANIKLSTDALLKENEALALKLDLMQKIANYGTEESPQVEQGVEFKETEQGQTFLKLLKDYQTKQKENWSVGQHLDYLLPWLTPPNTWQNAAKDLANSDQNPKYKEGSDYIRKSVLAITSKQEWDQFKEWYFREGPGYIHNPVNEVYSSNISDKDVKKLTDSQFYRQWYFAAPTNKRLENEIKSYDDFVSYLDTLTLFNPEDVSKYSYTAQTALTKLNLNPFINEFFNAEKYGYFGSEDWIENMKAIRDQHSTIYDENGNKLVEFATTEQFNNVIRNMYNSLDYVYRQLNPEVQKYYNSFFDKNYWESIGGGLDLSKYNTPIPFAPLMKQGEDGEMKYMIPNYYYDEWSIKRNNQTSQQLPSISEVNNALAHAEKGVVVNPNVTKNNNYTFTFQIETLRTDMDEDQLAQYIDEKFIPAVIDKLDASYEGVATA